MSKIHACRVGFWCYARGAAKPSGCRNRLQAAALARWASNKLSTSEMPPARPPCRHHHQSKRTTNPQVADCEDPNKLRKFPGKRHVAAFRLDVFILFSDLPSSMGKMSPVTSTSCHGQNSGTYGHPPTTEKNHYYSYTIINHKIIIVSVNHIITVMIYFM